MTPREKAIRLRLRGDLAHYAARCLKIKAKTGRLESFAFNRAQRYLHDCLEGQRSRTGMVRAVILKGRQQGCSTYVGARFYHAVTHRRGQKVFILTHEQDATNNLFGMVDRFHENCPALLKAHTSTSNAKELAFDILGSGYQVGTAGTKAVGRSQTIQLFHGSEVAFWPNADTHGAGILQAVPALPGTEIILESTANGFGNFFHSIWQKAEVGQSTFLAVFVPWFWQDEYRAKPPEGFSLDHEEQEYRAAHGLDLEQMAWRREKLIELGDPLLFRQEYPATASEAFQLTGHDSYIAAADLLKARKAACEESGPLVIGADPAWHGEDRFSLAWRCGRRVRKIQSRLKLDTVTGANWLRQVIDEDKPARVFIDVGGAGVGTVDILKSWGKPYSEIIKAVNFGGEPQTHRASGGPRNRRAEMWMRSREWLRDEAGAQIPDSDALQADATAPSYSYDMQGKLMLESKEHMRSRGARSPDEWDAVALTFAEPVGERPKLALDPPRERPRLELGRGAGTGVGWLGR